MPGQSSEFRQMQRISDADIGRCQSIRTEESPPFEAQIDLLQPLAEPVAIGFPGLTQPAIPFENRKAQPDCLGKGQRGIGMVAEIEPQRPIRLGWINRQTTLPKSLGQIVHDRARFGHYLPVIQHQRRNRTEWIDREKTLVVDTRRKRQHRYRQIETKFCRSPTDTKSTRTLAGV